MKKSIYLIAVMSLMLSWNTKSKDMNTIQKNEVIRISIGYYQAEKETLVEQKLQTEFKEKIMPAVKKLKGNIGYYVGIDKEKNSITNVSIWESREASLQMADLQEMEEMAKEFTAMGVDFKEITNHEIIWQISN